ncbi:MAG: glycosyltransferase family 2 protein [Acholeplasmatales bacterium]|nr:glycosyltransferase family 2 protein [Acholeplasmatales bacterium]
MLLESNAVITVEIINIILSLIVMIIFCMQGIHTVVTLFTRKKKYSDAKVNHKYGYIICARNEENVIGNLIDSIYSQDYPRELMNVFVCADNCTDSTASVAEQHNAKVFTHFNNTKKGKCYALDYVIKEILKTEEAKDIEAYFIFDADNLVSKEFTKEMNKLYDSGAKVATGLRDTKNFNQSLTSACSGLMFLRENLIIHHSRSLLGLSTYVAGTGFYVSSDIIKELNGWPFYSIIEDIDFSCYCAKNNIRIHFNESAIFYDEQPTRLKDVNTQHLRWVKGTYQCGHKYSHDLLKNTFFKKHIGFKNRLSSYEMAIHVSPMLVVATTITISYFLAHLIMFLNGIETGYYFTHIFLLRFSIAIISILTGSFFNGLIPMLKHHKNINASLYKKMMSVILFTPFVIMYIPIYYIALFKRNVKWVPIKHIDTSTINDINK